MSISFDYTCDECNHELKNNEPVYCTKCYDKLLNEISNLEDKLEDVTKENASLKLTVEQYEQDILGGD